MIADRIDLFAALPEDFSPVLPDGLPLEAALETDLPRPKISGTRAQLPRWAAGTALNDLPSQRWGIIAPAGAVGEELVAAISDLKQLRAEEQATECKVYPVRPGMSAEETRDWRRKVYRSADAREEDRPRYLVVLGDLDQISLSFQQALMHEDAFVGRLCFPCVADYNSYANKVVAACRRAPEEAANVLLYSARDKPVSTRQVGILEQTRRALILPTLTAIESGVADGLSVGKRLAVQGETLEDFVSLVATAHPTILMSVSHGLVRGHRGWSFEQQRLERGAPVLGHDGALTGGMLRSGAFQQFSEAGFLRHGAWICIACCSGAAMDVSTHYPWALRLAELGKYGGKATSLLNALTPMGFPACVADLPQAALAHPDGPLAFIGHADLAFSYAFVDEQQRTHPQYLTGVVQALLRRYRVGVALDALVSLYRSVSLDLVRYYQEEEEHEVWGTPRPDPVRKARAGLCRSDLYGYFLLGDPAAHLPVKNRTPGGV